MMFWKIESMADVFILLLLAVFVVAAADEGEDFPAFHFLFALLPFCIPIYILDLDINTRDENVISISSILFHIVWICLLELL